MFPSDVAIFKKTSFEPPELFSLLASLILIVAFGLNELFVHFHCRMISIVSNFIMQLFNIESATIDCASKLPNFNTRTGTAKASS